MKRLEDLTDEQRAALEQIDWWFKEKEAEMQRAHDKRMGELRRRDLLNLVLLVVWSLCMLASLAMMFWERKAP